jgi:crotonobetainyl-CoA:carnitine CoA-transferase CaiB-like acyl-CoA transferase
VVELADGVAAPFCARLFADYGADVVKLERPGRGDQARGWGPFPGDVPDPERSGVFFFCNTGKRSVALDPDDPTDRQRLDALLRHADVLVESQRSEDLRRWGLDPETLATTYPDLVAVSVTPFGRTGPYADWLGYDLNAYHLTATGSRYCGHPDRPPLEHGTFSADFFGGYAATAWALGALYGRDAIGGSTSTCRPRRWWPRSSPARRTSGPTPRKAASIAAAARACPSRRRRGSCPVATASSG